MRFRTNAIQIGFPIKKKKRENIKIAQYLPTFFNRVLTSQCKPFVCIHQQLHYTRSVKIQQQNDLPEKKEAQIQNFNRQFVFN